VVKDILYHLGRKYYLKLDWKISIGKNLKLKSRLSKKPIIETNVSGSGLGEYTTKYYPESGKFHCTCPGYWRSGGNCKHVKAMREKLGEAK
jgi:hypothetical protein